MSQVEALSKLIEDQQEIRQRAAELGLTMVVTHSDHIIASIAHRLQDFACPVCGSAPCFLICPTQDSYHGDQSRENDDYEYGATKSQF